MSEEFPCVIPQKNMCENINRFLNKNKISLLLLIDFSKAFDMVDYDIILYKLQHYSMRGKTRKCQVA